MKPPQDGPRLHLTAHERDEVCRLLRQRLSQARVLAYGSRVQGWSAERPVKSHSDLDLVVLDPVSDLALAELRADLDDSDLPWRVDLARFADLPATLQQAVQARGFELLTDRAISP